MILGRAEPPASRLRVLGFLLLLLASAGVPGAFAADGEPDETRVGGRLIWDLDDELDLLGDLWADLPFEIPGRGDLFLALDARTSISRTSSNLAFDVRDLDYALDLGWRVRRSGVGGRAVSLFAGQQGKRRVDAAGQAWVRYLALGLESRDYRRSGHSAPRLAWRFAAGPIVERREVEADLRVRGDLRWRPLRRRGPMGLEAELLLDGLTEGDRLLADLSLGPRLTFAVPGGREAALFLRYQRSRSPLGIGHSALLAGFEYLENPSRRGRDFGVPEIDGVVATGVGDRGRVSGQLKLRFLSPQLARNLHVAFVVDANLLTAQDTDELYYLYHLGLERPVGGNVAGVYFYHRSNHRLGDPDDRITSINVLEGGIETAGWHPRGGRPAAGAWSGLEARARAGILLDSSFGEERRWHVRGGLRWRIPLSAGRLSPYLLAEAEAGDVQRRTYGVGAAPFERWELQLEYRDDEQYFGEDRTALLLTARHGF